LTAGPQFKNWRAFFFIMKETAMHTRRLFLGLTASALLLAGCASQPTLDEAPPIVFVHGNGDSAALWQTTYWRFESNGWPRDRLYAIDVPYPSARDDDTKAQAGRTSTTEHMDYLKVEVERVLQATGARKVVLIGNSRGGNAIRNYIETEYQRGGSAAVKVSHAILGGTPNHGVWAIKGYNEKNEFSGTGPFLSGLNAARNAAGDEVTPGVQWMTIRSDNNDKFAQADGLWIGAKGTATNVTFAGPELRGASNIVIPRIDHRETSFSPAAFDATYRFITGRAPTSSRIQDESQVVLNGKITGLGLQSTDAKSGNFSNNLPVDGADLTVYATSEATGTRLGDAVHRKKVGADGHWGPFAAQAGVSYEFVVAAPGYATTHIYRSGFPRSSAIVHLNAARLADADQGATSVITLTRPRGYFDAARDKLGFDGQTPPPGVPPAGAGVSSSKIKLNEPEVRVIKAEFNGERLAGRTWPAADNQTVILELTN
jgi:pimeloyl-ACP methyl ester carboxylesterase